MKYPNILLLTLALGGLFCRNADAQSIVISEFLAQNDNGLRDEDGERNDWIELRNTTGSAVNLTGWYLTDTILRKDKWPFPSVTIPANGTLLVWASEKDRRDPSRPLHTNFKLSAGGEYLGLYKPGGMGLELSHDFAPTFPAQYADISYGLEQTTTNTTLIATGTACKYSVPANGNLDVNFGVNPNNWIGTAFNDTAWGVPANGLPLRFDQGTTTGLYDTLPGTDIETAMYNVRTSVYIRIPFTVSSVAALSAVRLRMQIDDGYIAYINGIPVPVGSFNGPENEAGAILFWNQPSAAEFPDTLSQTWQDVVVETSMLQNGNNLLCIHAFNRAATNTDFLVWPELTVSSSSAAPNVAVKQYFRVPTPANNNVNGVANPGPSISGTTENPVPPSAANLGPPEADSQAEFSGVQGLNGWSYGTANFGPLAGFDSYTSSMFAPYLGGSSSGAYVSIYTAVPPAAGPYNYWNGVLWDSKATGAPWSTVGPLTVHPQDSTPGVTWPTYNTTVGNPSYHPNITPLHAAVRRWTSDVSGNYVLTGYFNRLSASGNGTTGRIFHNGVQIFSAVTLADTKPFNLPVTLTVGDVVDMLVDVGPTDDDGSDGTNAYLSVRQQPIGPPTVLRITSRVASTVRPLASVICKFRTMQSPETDLAMKDDGTGGDAVAGDSIFTCQADITYAIPGSMLRWRIVATDDQANAVIDPPFSDPLNSPQYFGTVINDPTVATSQLPVIHWFPVSAASAGTAVGDRGSVFHLGEFYDNVRAKLHGQSTSGFAKKSYGFDFARDQRFRRKIGEKRVRDVVLLSNWADKSKCRNTLAWESYRAAGMAALDSFPVRVQQGGAFFGVYDMVEDADDLYLERAGLDPNGALYKMYNQLNSATHSYSGVEKKTRQQEGNADLASLLTNINTAVAQNTRRNYAYDNLDLPSLANNLAVTALIINQDQGHKNYFLYRDSEGTRQWQILPWDCDLTFGHTWTGSTAATTTAAPTIGANYFDDHIDSQRGLQLGAVNWIKTLLYSQPEFNKMYLRRLRTLMDEWLVSETATAGYFETRFAAVMDTMDPATLPANQTDLWLDGQKWGAWWPALPWKITAGNTSATVASNAANFATVWNLHGPRPSLGRIINPNGNSTTNLIADTTNNAANSFYISSESYTQGGATVNTSGGTNASLVYPDKTYPPFGGTSTSNGAAPPTFTMTGSPRTVHPFLKGRRLRLFDTSATRLTSSGAVIPLSQPALPNTQIQSVAYNPGSMGGLKQDAEYFVVKNHETTEIDISGWTITGGITYTFPGGCVIPPADAGSALPNPENIGLLHVAKSPYHFRQRSVSPKGAENRLVVGPYDGQLSARGETLELRTKAGALVHSTAWAGDPTAAQVALRVVEILYAPSAPTEAELAINPVLQASDFEFIVLENISGSPLVLNGATFTEGVSFTFGTLTLNPGQRVHLVANPAAFAMRRPAFASTVAGPYVGDLDNGGEQLHLKDAVGESVLEFAYDGAWYWPADENGHSLVIVDKNAPYTTWDAEQSWAPSLNLGGVIGSEPAGMIYKQFRRAEFTAPEQIDESLSGPEADLDADGSTNLIEYSASGQPDSPHSNLLPTVGLVVVSGENYATLTFRRNKSALDLVFNPEAGSDLDGYSPMLAHGASVDNLDGTESVTFRDSMIHRSENRRFMRLRVELVPEP